MKRHALKLALLALSVVATSCGQQLSKAKKENYGYGSVSMAQVESGYLCADRPQILPTQDNLDGTGQYTVCQSQSTTADILLHGTAGSSNLICIFPIQEMLVSGRTRIYAKPDLTTGLPMYQCTDYTRFKVTGRFPGVNYNAVAVVLGPEVDQMQRCLFTATANQSTDDIACPRYSYGRFRD